MAKDFFRKRPPSKRKSSLLALSRTSKIKAILNKDRSINMQTRVAPHGIIFQNQFKQIIEEQEQAEKSARKKDDNN